MLRQSNIKLLNFGVDWFKQTKAIKHVVKKNIKYVPENIFLIVVVSMTAKIKQTKVKHNQLTRYIFLMKKPKNLV